jgi:NAD(P)H-hydrate epimerase
MPTLLLMENAARGLAEEARRHGRRFVVLCGPGNNGGDGLGAARHLGTAAEVFLLSEPDASRAPDAALQLSILRKAGRIVRCGVAPEPLRADDRVWIDALYGTGLTRAPSGPAAEWISRFNAVSGRKIAADVPSGLDADRGLPLGPCVRADVTVTFHAAKVGLLLPSAAPFVGQVVVAPLGLP